jgi:hypothetical protein
MQHGIDPIIPVKLEILPKLLLTRRRHRLPHIRKHAKVRRIFLVVLPSLEHTGAHQAGIPPVHVTTDDI